MNNVNPFSLFNDAFKPLGNFNVGNFSDNPFDFNKFFASGKRNVEAFSAAGQVVIESAQEISRRQADIARLNVENFITASRDMMSGKSPETSTARQVEFTKSLYESGIKNARELSDIISKSSTEAFDIINKRTSENIAEFSAAAKAA